jgi:hypothetical protein
MLVNGCNGPSCSTVCNVGRGSLEKDTSEGEGHVCVPGRSTRGDKVSSNDARQLKVFRVSTEEANCCADRCCPMSCRRLDECELVVAPVARSVGIGQEGHAGCQNALWLVGGQGIHNPVVSIRRGGTQGGGEARGEGAGALLGG